MSIEWYAVHTYVGQEDRVQEQLMDRARRLGMYRTKIFQVIQPEEDAVELQEGGKKVNVKRKLFPGYVFVQMDVEDDDAPGELVRRDATWTELHLTETDIDTPAKVAKVIAATPKIMQRPVLVRAGRAIIGRPKDRVPAFLAGE